MSDEPKWRYYWTPLAMPGDSFDPARAIEITPLPSKPKTIVCLPTPGRNGIEWVPDFYGVTKFG